MYISGLENFSDANGDGFRTVLYVSGCSHHCNGCQNPQTWNPENGVEYNEEIEEKVLNMLFNKNISGLTLSGGDPLFDENLDSVLHLVQRIKNEFNNTATYSDYENENHNMLIEKVNKMRVLFKNNKTVWLYTGYTFEQCLLDEKRNNILKYIDVMVDGRFENDKKDLSLKFRGSSNQRVIDVQKSLETREIVSLYTD